MRIISKSRNHFYGTHKGASIEIDRDQSAGSLFTFYIMVTAKDGGHLYDGYAPEGVTTMRQAKREAIKGACLDAARESLSDPTELSISRADAKLEMQTWGR